VYFIFLSEGRAP